MKKIIVGTMLAAICASVFALTLPTGDNVRASDTKMDGDKILEVEIGGEKPANITTPLGVFAAESGYKVSFYPSGALKHLWVNYTDAKILSTPFGDIRVQGDMYFYESGSPAKIGVNAEDDFYKITIGGVEYTAYDGDIYFYDSGSKDSLLPMRVPYKNGDSKFKFEYKNKSGTFTMYPNKNDYSVYEFFPDGTLRGAKLKSSSDDPVIVNGSEVYIKGQESIEFFQDGSISYFSPDELIQAEQGGIKFTIPAGNKVWLHKNGKIRAVIGASNINPKSITVGKTQCDLSSADILLFDENGNLVGYNDGDTSVFDLYSDGKIKRNLRYDLYASKRFIESFPSNEHPHLAYDESYVYSFFSPAGEEWYVKENGIESYEYGRYKVHSDDFGSYIANVIFVKEIPAEYTTFKHDLFGNYILDEYGRPIEDTTKKKFTK